MPFRNYFLKKLTLHALVKLLHDLAKLLCEETNALRFIELLFEKN